MEQTTNEQFAIWLRDQLARRGYDLSVRGGQARFAKDTGISPATLSRIFRGEGATDTKTLALIAQGIDLPLGVILVQAGVLDESELRAVQHPTSGRRITPDEAATELGIDDEQARSLFTSMVETLRRHRKTLNTGENAAEN